MIVSESGRFEITVEKSVEGWAYPWRWSVIDREAKSFESLLDDIQFNHGATVTKWGANREVRARIEELLQRRELPIYNPYSGYPEIKRPVSKLEEIYEVLDDPSNDVEDVVDFINRTKGTLRDLD